MKNTLFIFVSIALMACNQDTKPAAAATTPAATAETKPAPTTQQHNGLAIGDKLYVQAPSGLVLRKTPAKDGEKVTSAPCNGSPLTVLALPDPANRYVAEKIGSFEVSGGWVNVQTQDHQTGYLFEGYLSHYKPFDINAAQEMTGMEFFYQQISPAKGAKETLPAQPEAPEGYRVNYQDGAKFEFTPYAGGVTQYLYLSPGKMTMQEALVLFRPIAFGQRKTTAKYDAAKQLLTINNAEESEQLTIQTKDGRLVIQYSLAD